MQSAVGLNWPSRAGEHDVDFELIAAERLFFAGQQVEAASARGLVRVVAQLAALVVLAAGETGPGLVLFVALAREGAEAAFGRNGIGEQLIGSAVIAKVTVRLVTAAVRCNKGTSSFGLSKYQVILTVDKVV